MNGSDSRSEQLAESLGKVQQRIFAATRAAGRVQVPELIVVTKSHPAGDVQRLYELGVREVGENRDQEASSKAVELKESAPELRWNFIGQVQTNKAKSIVKYAHSVHSVDREPLVNALSKARGNLNESGVKQADLECFIQVDLDPAVAELGAELELKSRGGALPSQILQLAESITDAPALSLAGLMAVAPLGVDPAPAFERLQKLSQRLCQSFPHANKISAGMSADLEVAVQFGATHLRVGSDVLGPRPTVR